MHGFYFGDRHRQLYGAYDAPVQPSSRAVVICQPWGPEGLSGHQSLRRLARVLADNDVHAMRFDYYGTGDSAGNGSDTTLESMLADLDYAVEECADLSQLEQVWLVGVRLGGTLAAQYAPTAGAVSGVVLWDPIVDGPAYLDQLEQNAKGQVEGAWDVGGFLLSPEMRHQIADFALSDPPERGGGRPCHAFCFKSSCDSAVLERAGYGVQVYNEPPPWLVHADFGSIAVPNATISAITEFLRDH